MGSWSTSKDDATQLTAITTTEQFFSLTPSVNPEQWLHCQVEYNPPGTPTDKLIVSVYSTLDDTSENWDNQPIMSFTLDNSPDPNARSFLLHGYYKYRIGVKMNGSTDTTGTADLGIRTATP